MAATYLFLEDHLVGNNYIYAGDVASEGGLLPNGWIPTPNVDPLNTDAVNAFYRQGPRIGGPIRTQWTTRFVPPPATFWTFVKPFSPGFGPGFGANLTWALTGLGSNQTLYPPVTMP